MPVFDRSAFNLLFPYLREEGGNENATGNYSATPTDFFVRAPTSDVFALSALFATIEDLGKIRSCDYGAGDPLINGITVNHTDSEGGEILSLTNGVPIRCNGQWISASYDRSVSDEPAGFSNWMTVRWALGSERLPLVLRYGERLAVTLNDDFTGLVSHRFRAQVAVANYLHRE